MQNKMLNLLMGGEIVDVSRICNLISLEIKTTVGKTIFLHTQCFFRIIKKGRIILCSEDIYKCGHSFNEKDFAWDVPGQSLYDESMEKHKKELFNSKILQVEQTKVNDLCIMFDNDMVLQIFVDTTNPEEKYRIFNEKETYIVTA